MKKTVIILSAMLVAFAMILVGCADDAEYWGADDNGTYTGSGHEYRAYTDEDSASVEYLDANVDIEKTEFVRDDLDDHVRNARDADKLCGAIHNLQDVHHQLRHRMFDAVQYAGRS